MSNFDDVLADNQKRRDERSKSSKELFDSLDRMPNTKIESNSKASPAARSDVPTSSPPTVANVTAPREDATGTENIVSKRMTGSALTRGNSAQDAELIEEVGIAMKMCGFGEQQEGDPLGQQLCAFAGLHPPSEQSFCDFFKTWFTTQHFPGMSEALKYELVQRAKSKGFFSGLSSQIKKFAMANTDARLQADAWHAYFMKHAPPTYKTYGCLRLAFVNLGAVAQPCWVKFYGLPAAPDARDNADQWVLMPWTNHDADICALVDELDGRGGMAALLEVVASPGGDHAIF